MTTDPPGYMGTQENAHKELLKAARRYRLFQGPHVGTAAELRTRDIHAREARNRLADAALLWLWHQEQPHDD